MLTAAIGATVAFFLLRSPQRLNCPSLKASDVNVAIFTPTTHLALEQIEQGFKETVQSLLGPYKYKDLIHGPGNLYTFTTFNANGNKTLLRAQAEEIVSGNYDLILTIGAGCSQIISELLAKKKLCTQHIFCGVDGPEFAQGLQALNASSTGVYLSYDYRKEMELLNKLKPNVKNILLVYDPTHGTGMERSRQEIENIAKGFGATLHSVEVYQANEIQQKVSALLPKMDVVLVLTDNTVVAGIDALITLCNRYGVTLLASDLASGQKGAALAYGVTEYESGSEAAKKMEQMLKWGMSPHEIPVSAVTHFRIQINRKTMEAQGLHIDDQTIKQLEAQEPDDWQRAASAQGELKKGQVGKSTHEGQMRRTSS